MPIHLSTDEISAFVGLVLLAIMVYLADPIKSIISINLILLMIIVFVGYTVIRGIIQAENKEVKQKIIKGVAIVIGCVGVTSVIGRFFANIGIIAVPIGCFIATVDRNQV